LSATEPQAKRETVVGRVEELPPGSVTIVPVGKFGVGVFNVAGTYYAVTNYCPHEGAPLCQGSLTGTTAPQPGREEDVAWIKEGEVIRCPWHRWEFDLKTGKVISDPTRGIRVYEVEVRDGEVFLVT
jgi:nitrite reductase/ring-hydroxylating ferredoxin subunit